MTRDRPRDLHEVAERLRDGRKGTKSGNRQRGSRIAGFWPHQLFRTG